MVRYHVNAVGNVFLRLRVHIFAETFHYMIMLVGENLWLLLHRKRMQ